MYMGTRLLGERPTKYFLNLEKQKALSKTIHKLQNDSDQVITERQEVLDEIKRYYETLYTDTGNTDTSYTDKIDFPHLPNEIRESLEEDITMNEINVALKDLDNAKTPSTDGLPADFYKVF